MFRQPMTFIIGVGASAELGDENAGTRGYVAAGCTDLVADRMTSDAWRRPNWLYTWIYNRVYRGSDWMVASNNIYFQCCCWMAWRPIVGISRGPYGLEKEIHRFSISVGPKYFKLRRYPTA